MSAVGTVRQEGGAAGAGPAGQRPEGGSLSLHLSAAVGL